MPGVRLTTRQMTRNIKPSCDHATAQRGRCLRLLSADELAVTNLYY